MGVCSGHNCADSAVLLTGLSADSQAIVVFKVRILVGVLNLR